MFPKNWRGKNLFRSNKNEGFCSHLRGSYWVSSTHMLGCPREVSKWLVSGLEAWYIPFVGNWVTTHVLTMDSNFLGHPSAHWLGHEYSHQVHRQRIILHYYTTIQCTVFQASIFTARQGQGCTNDQDSVFQKSRRYLYRIYLQVRLAFTQVAPLHSTKAIGWSVGRTESHGFSCLLGSWCISHLWSTLGGLQSIQPNFRYRISSLFGGGSHSVVAS